MPTPHGALIHLDTLEPHLGGRIPSADKEVGGHLTWALKLKEQEVSPPDLHPGPWATP